MSERTLTCCGGTTTVHRSGCANVVRSALSWIEDTRHGDKIRAKALAAFEEIVRERDEAKEMLALCAADTTAVDLRQEVEFLKAELEQARAALGVEGEQEKPL